MEDLLELDMETELYCTCQKPYVEGQFMIECGKCNEWFHGSCVGIEEYQASDIDVYHCPKCQPIYGPLVLKKRRNISRHNYKEIHDGTKQITAGSIMFVRQLKSRKFLNGEDIIIQFENGKKLSTDYLQENGFKYPILVYEKEGLDMVVPPSNFTVYDVEKKVGSLFDLHVIDVARQEDMRMKMREWTEYFNSPRGKVLNVISLEFSNTDLSELVMAPAIVRNISWVENVWPKDPPEESPHSQPVVAKYCLMSVKDCYTDFHVDFGGTSVWYHIVRGDKIFYLIEPTAENLQKYSQWVSSSDQTSVFFGDKVDKCYKLHLTQGNTLFIPSGWIHSVLTPKDTLVFGGNFLHSFCIPQQNLVYTLEKTLQTPLTFLLPNFETTNWYAAKKIGKKMKNIHKAGFRVPDFLLTGVKELVNILKAWTSKKDDLTKYHKLQIPIELDASDIIRALEVEITDDTKLGPGNAFCYGKMPSPAIMASDPAKKILKLKLSSKTEDELDGKSSKLSIKKDKVKKIEDSSSDITLSAEEEEEEEIEDEEVDLEFGKVGKKKKKRGRPRIEPINLHLQKGKAKYKTDLNVKVKVSEGKVISSSSSNKTSSSDLKRKNQSDSSNLNDNDSSIKLTFYNSAPPQKEMLDKITTSPVKPNIDLKAEFEAAKKDIFDDSKSLDDSKKLFFKPMKTEKDCTVKPVSFNLNKNFPSKPKIDDDDNLLINEAKPKSDLPSKKMSKSPIIDDYDPAEDAYYEDADFVYPRIDVTSEISEEDFSWRPSQRKKPKSNSSSSNDKRKNSQSSQSSQSSGGGGYMEALDPFFAPDDEDESNSITIDSKGDELSSMEDLSRQKSMKEKQDKPKKSKGFATPKQRLGKLLKLDKTGSRYVR